MAKKRILLFILIIAIMLLAGCDATSLSFKEDSYTVGVNKSIDIGIKVIPEHVLGNIKEMLYSILTTMIHDDIIQHVHYVVQFTLRIRRQRPVCLVLIHSRILLKPCESDYDSIGILKNDE